MLTFTHHTQPLSEDEAKLSPEELDRLHAQRWRALMAMPKITTMGWAGFQGDQQDYRHLSLNFWTHMAFSNPNDSAIAECDARSFDSKQLLVHMVDVMRQIEAERHGTEDTLVPVFAPSPRQPA